MYLTTTDMIANCIALGVSIVMIVLLGYANYTLLKENRYLKNRLRANRIAYMRLNNYK